VDALGLPAAAVAALCYGAASVLQAHSAKRSAGSGTRLLLRLATQIPYLTGLLLDLCGFGLSVFALRSEPLYVVQAIVASNLAVTALVVAAFYRTRLAGREWVAIGAVCGGLALLGLSAGHEGTQPASLAVRAGLLGGMAVLVAVAILLSRTDRAAVLGAVAGLAYGGVAVAARILPSFAPLRLLADPAAWALAIGAVVGTLFFATALQRGRVTTVTAMMVVGETVVPAALGVALLGDTVRHGAAPVIAIGFVLSLAGTLTLARSGAVTNRRCSAPDARSC
jgi:drug/metabolite transporter (DMT)-like permease